MEAVTYKCPDCGAALKFDTESGMLYCEFCVQYYPAEFCEKEQKPQEKARSYWSVSDGNSGYPRAAWEGPTAEEIQRAKEHNEGREMTAEAGLKSDKAWEKMQVRIYQCQSCGAEVMTGDTEVSRMCSFCGNPTILFDRISEENRPTKIIPFKMKKEEALRRVKERFGNSILLDCNLNEIQTDSIYPIYMPYWVYKINYGLTGTVYVQKSDRAKGRYSEPYMDAYTETRDVPMDASKRFQDDISRLLNPFRFEEAEDFSPAYLSGFYADRSDVSAIERQGDGRRYMRERATNAMLNRTPGVPGPAIRAAYEHKLLRQFMGYSFTFGNEAFEVLKTDYMLLPVYFFTLRINDKPVIILVNGQTGKIVGNMPIDQKKVQGRQVRDSILCAVLGGVLGAVAFNIMLVQYTAPLFLFILALLIVMGKSKKKQFKIRYYRTNSAAMSQLSKDRK